MDRSQRDAGGVEHLGDTDGTAAKPAGARWRPGPHDPVERVVWQTRGAMAIERALRAFWPLASLIAALWAALAFGFAEAAPRPLLLAALGLGAAAALWLGWRGVSRFRWPTPGEARARVDADLPGRPLAALADAPALGRDDPGSLGVWRAHMARMRLRAAAARAAPPDARLSREDPWALRLGALALLIAAILFARSDAISGLGAALAPSGAAAVATGPSFEAWAEPPAYTGKPTLYLTEVPSDPPLPVPAGSRVTLRVYGPPEGFALTETVSGAATPPLAEAADGIAVASFDVTADGSVSIAEGGRTLGAWSFVVTPDAAPTIALAEPVDRAPTGEAQIAWEAGDDYGVATARAEIALDLAAVDRRFGLAPEPAPRDPIVIDLPLPMSGDPGEIADVLVEDFSKDLWAGLPVTLTLSAADAVGQTGASAPESVILPGRRFYNPIAAALVEQRRDLLWNASNAPRVVQVLRAMTWRPESLFRNKGAYLSTRIAIRRLDRATELDDNAAQVGEVAEMLWRIALLLEDGSLGDAAERLARAKERLQEALRSDASDEEIAQLMDELRQATRDYMQQLAEEAIRNGEQQQAEAPPPGQTMTQDQIQELMDRIQELSEQGRRAEAEALLEMLQQMLENMEMQMAQGGQGQGQQGQPGQGEQSMQDFGDALREQQDLADESFQELQRQFREGRNQGEGGESEGENQGQGQGAPSGEELAGRQEALRDLMEQLQQGMPGEAGEAAREALREAERSMGEAGDDLRGGDTSGALDSQAEAIDNLREGMREMARDMREAENQARGGQPGEDGEATADGRNDPLGRPLGSQGSLGTNENMLPGADAQARARALLDEIRRRSGEQARPQLELDYLRRLLDQF